MTKKYSVKKALVASLLSLALCFSMLVGTTFAWFTDSVTSANNIIKSGNLDVELYYQLEDETDWTKVTEKTNVFKDTLWEPGHTEVVKLKIVNEGSLALKYNLGVNVASEVGSVNVNGDNFLLSEYIKFAVIDGANTYTRDEAIAAAEAEGATALKTAYNSGTTQLRSAEDDYVTMVVYMPTTVGNEANPAKGAATPTINLGLNLFATQIAYEEDSFDNQYDADAMTIVTTAAEAQAALDNATAGTIIKLAPGNYGTLYLRPVAGSANTVTDCDYLIYGNEMLRKVENLTIVGTEGATVDAIVTEAGYVKDSGSTGYVVDIKNLVIDSVNFTDDYKNSNTAHKYSAPLFFDLSYTNVDGLTVKNCSLVGDNDMMNFVYFYGSGAPSNSTFGTAAKNITITNNIVDGIARLCELRQAENVTITNNIIKNTALHGVLLPVDGGTYTGNVTITGNTAEGINERFVRMAGAGNATVVIKDNTINNYFGADDDFIKVTDGTNVTVENNTLVSIGVKDAAAAQAALDNAVPGTTIQLQPGVNYGTLYLRPVAGSAATKDVDWIGNNYGWETYTLFEDVTIVGAPGATVDAIEIEGGTYYHTEHSQAATYPVMLSLVELKNVVIDGVTFTGKGGYDPQGYGNAINLAGNNIKVNGLTLKNCVLENEGNNARLLYKTEGTTHVHTYAYEGVEYTFVGNLKDITVTGCTFNGGYMGLELRETENLTITNNVFNVADRNILLPVNTGCTYTGNVTITGNVSNNAKERFVRADGMGDAVVVIKDNTIVNYMGADADYIKVTNANNVTIENNVMATEVYGLTLIPNGENSKIIVNDKEGFLNLTKLFADWRELFTDGNGNELNNYANGAGADYYYGDRWTISLEADIDLNNATIAPVTINHPVSTGDPTFDGNNHTIKNAKIVADATAECMAGLFHVSHEAFKNLKLDNIHVTGSNVGNSSAGILAGSCHGRIDNITITNASVTGGKYTGGVVGYGYTDISNCTLTNVTVKGGYKLGGIIGYICASDVTGDVTGNTLTDCTVDGIGNGIFAGGKTEYVIGQVVGNYDCNGTCNNNTVTNMTSSATDAIGKIEAGKTVTQ